MWNIATIAVMIVSIIVGSSLTGGVGYLWNRFVDNPRVEAAAREGMVKQAQLEAAKAREEALKKIADRQEELRQQAEARAAAATQATLDLQKSIEDTNQENAKLQERINELNSKPVDSACTVTEPFAHELRGR